MIKAVSIVAGVGISTLGLHAQAQPPTTQPPPPSPYDTTLETEGVAPGAYSYAWSDPRMRSEIGIGVTLGGGVTGFTDGAMRDVVTNDVGGLWNVRGTIGTHIPLGVDIAYLGTASELETLAGFDNGTLIGTTVEVAPRFNILPHYAWNPYVFAGVGWQRYDVTGENFATADTGMRDSDDVLEFPLGAGIAYRDPTGLVVDLRGTFRATTEPDLLRQPDGDQADLHTWEASGAIGYEF